MPLYVTIAGHDYEVIDETAEQSESTEIGVRRRAFNGGMRSSVQAEKREWKFSLVPFTTNAALEVLRVSVLHGKIVSCGGADIMGVTLNCVVKLGAASYIYRGVSYERGVVVTITEA